MKQVIVTTSWDDGHKLDLRVVRLLKKYNIKGTFYIAPKNRQYSLGEKIPRKPPKYWRILRFYLASKGHRFSKEDLLTEKQIIRFSKGFEIGGHTITHPYLTEINEHEAKKEIVESKKYFEMLLNNKVVSFCYPDGRNNAQVQRIVANAGFIYARTTQRYQFTLSKNAFESGTSLHAMNQYQDIFKIAKFTSWQPLEALSRINWELLAKAMFDYVLKNGGVFHLFGHSWIIDIFDDWNKLERVLSYIGNRRGVKYVENSGLVNFAK